MCALKRSLALVAAAFVAMTTGVSEAADDFPKNILTGGPSGTYIQFGRDLSREMGRCGLTLNVRESAGSLENFLGVRKRRHTQFGIVQSDVLEFLKTYASEDPEVARAVFGVRIAVPLYNEEVHILAKREIQDLNGLNQRRVSIGVEDSGTFLTASLVLDLTGINGAERVNMNAGDSLKALLAGDIDAFFYVAGAPTKLFESAEIDPARFHLLPVRDETLQAVYLPVRLAAGTYPFQSEPVDVVAVKAVLMTYEYDKSRNSYHRQSCKAVSDLTHVLLTRFKALQETGHPKWKNVDLNDLPPGWDVSSCVNAGLAADYPLSCNDDPAPVERAPASGANEVYRKRICAAVGC